MQSTIINGPDGRPTQLTPVDDGYIDYFGRPWAQNWEQHFEQGWEKPATGGNASGTRLRSRDG